MRRLVADYFACALATWLGDADAALDMLGPAQRNYPTDAFSQVAPEAAARATGERQLADRI